MKNVIKSKGAIEDYKKSKIKKSLELTFVSNHFAQESAKKLAKQIADEVDKSISKKEVITHKDIRHIVAKKLAKVDKKIAEQYQKFKEMW